MYWDSRGAGGTLAIAMVNMFAFCRAAKRSGALCMSCPLNSSGKEERGCEWKVLVGDESVLSKCFQMLRVYGLWTSIRGFSSAISKDTLTPRQGEMVREAVRRGFFDFPRKISLISLAEMMLVRPSTLSEHLRSAEAKMARYYLESHVAA